MRIHCRDTRKQGRFHTGTCLRAWRIVASWRGALRTAAINFRGGSAAWRGSVVQARLFPCLPPSTLSSPQLFVRFLLLGNRLRLHSPWHPDRVARSGALQEATAAVLDLQCAPVPTRQNIGNFAPLSSRELDPPSAHVFPYPLTSPSLRFPLEPCQLPTPASAVCTAKSPSPSFQSFSHLPPPPRLLIVAPPPSLLPT